MDQHSIPAPRRTFLRNLLTIPLIGSGMTLIGQPAVAVPLVQAAALPTFEDPRQRARYAWEAFTSAMDDLTAQASGWRVVGAGTVRPCGPAGGYSFARFAEVHVGPRNDLEGDGLIVERTREIALDAAEEAALRSREARRA